MTIPTIYSQQEILKYNQGELEKEMACIVREAPLTIYLNDQELATLVCSPRDYEELAMGFLLSEGLIKGRSDIKEITLRQSEGLVWVQTSEAVPQTEDFLRRNLASCCGKGRSGLFYVNDARQLEPVVSSSGFSAPELLELMAKLDQNSATFRQTGGVHSAGLGQNHELLVSYEDIGRHNAVDKVLGYMLMQNLAPGDKCILLTGRVASEILIKVARIGTPLVVSRSAPTVLAVELARELGITLVGFTRGERMNIYCHAERISF